MDKYKEKNFVSAVIYVNNAEKRIEQFLKNIIEILESTFEYSEIICVNDYSSDDSVEIIKKIGQNLKSINVSILNMSFFHGLETSMKAGVDLAIGDFVFEFDDTLMDYLPTEIIKVYRRALEGYDIVSAVSDSKDRLFSRLFYKLYNGFSSINAQMRTESFRVLSRRAINRVNSLNKTIPYRKAVYLNCGLRTDIIVYHAEAVERKRNSRMERRYRRELAVDTLILFTDLGYKFSLAMMMLMMMLAVFMAIYSIVIYSTASPVEGWMTTILFLSVAFLGVFGIMAVVIKYLQLLINLVFRRKFYSFESIEKITR